MQNKYAIYFIASVIATGAHPLVSHGQQTPPAKPVGSTVVRLSEFIIPPQPIALIDMRLMPDGQVQYQTMMPIAGRVATVDDAAKQRGTGALPAGVCLYTATVDRQGQPGVVTSSVVGQRDRRIKIAEGMPLEWAVWNINSKDGPSRLPYGGGYERMPEPALPASSVKVSFAASGKGFNYATYSLYPVYNKLTRSFDSTSFQYRNQREELTLLRQENMAKLIRYIPVEGDTRRSAGRVIQLAPNRFEGVATHYVEDDKNASLRAVSFLTFDEAGNLLTDQRVNFQYNRKLLYRVPVYDPSGKVVGTFNVFDSGGGKKETRDPQDNRFAVVVTDEKGAIWKQFDWTNGEGSQLAVMPIYMSRRGNELLAYINNQQKLLKPVEENWLFDATGKAALLNSMPYSALLEKSTIVGMINSGNRVGWYNHTPTQFVDAFTDANGDVWVLKQRETEGPIVETTTAASPVPGPAKGIIGFANKLNAIAGQASPSLPNNQVVTEIGTNYGDLFAMQFDKDMKLKHQTVIAMSPSSEQVRFKRINRAAGVDYVFANSVNTHLRFRNGELTVEQLMPVDGIRPGAVEVDNFVVDEAAGKVYVLSMQPKKLVEGKLSVYSLD
ncbi:hypothetical protein [Spirosoma rhododendri]|uniref:Uncharacterized protein n=1 Tax=Spirosoma rhododendri TaxID=2728024 RepID=A0A7L5DIW0_9BACT|nr:hypothetical protein [Spirosoma rhododendri]QJD78329.1 hypothetical protein HH216_07750 [Spirosoma rhododendri]